MLRRLVEVAPKEYSVNSISNTIDTDLLRGNSSGVIRASSLKYLKYKKPYKWSKHSLPTQVPLTSHRNGCRFSHQWRHFRQRKSQGTFGTYQSVVGCQHCGSANLQGSPWVAENKLEQRPIKQGADIWGIIIHKGSKDNNWGECGSCVQSQSCFEKRAADSWIALKGVMIWLMMLIINAIAKTKISPP